MEELLLYQTEGQAAASVGAVITLIVGIGISVMILIFVGALGGQSYNIVEPSLNAIGVHEVVGATFTADNVTSQYLGHSAIHTGTLVIANGTTNVLPGNFTISYTNGYALLSGDMTYNGTELTVNYTWGDIAVQHSVKNGIINSFNGLEQTGEYLPIVVLAVIISLVLMLILGFTAFGGSTGGGRGSAL